MRNNKVTFVYTEDHDWVAMYIDGVMVTEGHSIDPREAIGYLGFDVKTKHVSNEWCEEQGGTMPEKEKDCNKGLTDE